MTSNLSFPGRRWRRLCALALLFGAALPAVAQSPRDTPQPPPPPEIEKPVGAPATTGAAQPPPPDNAATPTTQPSTGGRYLLLPDISLNGIFSGRLSNDKRDMNRERFRLQEAELAVQSFVYPNVRLDTFIVISGEGEVGAEEAYLTFQQASALGQHFSAVVGRRKAPFGRVNQLHPHSWLYVVQPYVLTNLVSEESLTGDGAYISYLLPTGKIFTQLDFGFFSKSEAAEPFDANPSPADGIVSSPGAGFADKFLTARLLTAFETLGGSVELGGSIATGRGLEYGLANQGDSEDPFSVRPHIQLTGADFTYRRAGLGTKRLLLRGEYVRHHQRDGGFTKNTDGWYLFADQRLDPVTSLGIRYDQSGFPYASGRERGVSLIATRQLTESTYYRVQFIEGSRPGKRNAGEIHLSLVWGVGPHTHNLE